MDTVEWLSFFTGHVYKQLCKRNSIPTIFLDIQGAYDCVYSVSDFTIRNAESVFAIL